mmetsp:Transcript_18724/g.38054  ORF Transcript_18724/g.38054 Transcript_18724/m.38054 type:complete len:233 (+) Transcript_18724:1088-1786(+)
MFSELIKRVTFDSFNLNSKGLVFKRNVKHSKKMVIQMEKKRKQFFIKEKFFFIIERNSCSNPKSIPSWMVSPRQGLNLVFFSNFKACNFKKRQLIKIFQKRFICQRNLKQSPKNFMALFEHKHKNKAINICNNQINSNSYLQLKFASQKIYLKFFGFSHIPLFEFSQGKNKLKESFYNQIIVYLVWLIDNFRGREFLKFPFHDSFFSFDSFSSSEKLNEQFLIFIHKKINHN